MLNRRHLLAAIAGSTVVAVAPIASAADRKAFDQKAFEAAQASGKPILLEVSAPWCPVCKAQAPILSRLRSQPRFKDLVSLNIDFDSQKQLLQKFNVQKQSTLIVVIVAGCGCTHRHSSASEPGSGAASTAARETRRPVTPGITSSQRYRKYSACTTSRGPTLFSKLSTVPPWRRVEKNPARSFASLRSRKCVNDHQWM